MKMVMNLSELNDLKYMFYSFNEWNRSAVHVYMLLTFILMI